MCYSQKKKNKYPKHKAENWNVVLRRTMIKLYIVGCVRYESDIVNSCGWF